MLSAIFFVIISNSLQSFDDLMAKLQISRYLVEIVDSEGDDQGKSVGPDYVVEVQCSSWNTEFCW